MDTGDWSVGEEEWKLAASRRRRRCLYCSACRTWLIGAGNFARDALMTSEKMYTQLFTLCFQLLTFNRLRPLTKCQQKFA
jgi:hypothetical protein